MPNRLALETSPYLLQHSQNPVDWYPWGEEAFERARREDKPVLLSIGYSSCHWCHVMEHESFENEEIAALMNENFVNIKVDREERPDLDHIYMEAVQAMTGSGGWPMTVFLTPAGEPFYGGTYFPPEDRHNLPGFPRVLKAVLEAYYNRREDIQDTAFQLKEMLRQTEETTVKGVQQLTESILQQAYTSLRQSFDITNGGFGRAPKFPQPLALEFLLRYYARSKQASVLEMLETTLDRMSRGGIYDQIGGGFHRYATDNKWLVPHFEKMLYDNALLSRVYLHAYLASGQSRWAKIASETLNYVLREMRSSEGGFYSTQDADSEGEEGKYYIWTPEEIREASGERSGQQVIDYYGVTSQGNFEGSNILFRPGEPEPSEEIQEAKRSLLAWREKRIKPGRDEKVLASWNGLMLAALAEGACILRNPEYLAASIKNGDFLLNSMMSGGKLYHSYKDGQAKIPGFLEDYAMVTQGLLALHRASLDVKWFQAAIGLTERMVELFYDENIGLLYDTEAGKADLIVRPRNDYDGATPSASSVATKVLLEMAVLTGNDRFRRIAERSLNAVKANAGRVPLGYGQWLCDIDFYISIPQEIVLAGPVEHPMMKEYLQIVCSKWLPNSILAAFDPANVEAVRGLPLFEGRSLVNNQPAAYICRNYTCQSPITNPEVLKRSIAGEIESN